MEHRSLASVVVSLAWILAACAMNPPPKAEPEAARISCRVPTFAPLAETKESQEKGGVGIAAAPVVYEVRRTNRETLRDVSPSFGERLTAPDGWQRMRFVERVSMPSLQVVPDRLRFRVTITNKLPRVFRGEL